MTPSDTGPILPMVEVQPEPGPEEIVALQTNAPELMPQEEPVDQENLRESALASLRETREAARRNAKKTKIAFEACRDQNDTDQFKRVTGKLGRRKPGA